METTSPDVDVTFLLALILQLEVLQFLEEWWRHPLIYKWHHQPAKPSVLTSALWGRCCSWEKTHNESLIIFHIIYFTEHTNTLTWCFRKFSASNKKKKPKMFFLVRGQNTRRPSTSCCLKRASVSTMWSRISQGSVAATPSLCFLWTPGVLHTTCLCWHDKLPMATCLQPHSWNSCNWKLSQKKLEALKQKRWRRQILK